MDTKKFNEQQKVMVEEKSKKEVQSNGNYRIKVKGAIYS